MSIHDFQNAVQKNESNDLLEALRAVHLLDGETVGDLGWDPWFPGQAE